MDILDNSAGYTRVRQNLRTTQVVSWKLETSMGPEVKGAFKGGKTKKGRNDHEVKGLKRRRTWTIWPNKTILESFCRKMIALSPGYYTFEKCLADTKWCHVND
jgi:hypothetical protein